MKLYRFSPIKTQAELLQAITHTHLECYKLCKHALGHYLPNAGNIGVFCHYEDEYQFLTDIRRELTEPSDNPLQKYFRLLEPIIIAAHAGIPETTYTHLYIRRPDPYRHHVGDVDFYLQPKQYLELKEIAGSGKAPSGMRVFDRVDLDMVELFDPDVDALAYISTHKMTQRVRAKIKK